MAEPMSDERLAELRRLDDQAILTPEESDLLAEIDRLRAENASLKDTSNWAIIGTWLAERDVYEGEFIPGFGTVPNTDAEPIIDLSTLPGWADIARP